MIKIPGTPEGVPAIEQATYEGINVNVTLLFSVAAYSEVAEAYIRGLERRHAEGKSLDIHSVASFFVSRVDTEVDKRLEKLGRPDLAGRAGLANARAAYRRFQEIFHGERFAALLEAGAPVQRPLWASTGVKNPHYSDTMYVDGLVGPESVNTMPLATLQAAADHADVTGEPTVLIDPTPDLEALRDAGIDLDDVTEQLLEEGVELFQTAMDKLLAGVESKREAVVTGRPTSFESVLPDELEPAIAARVKRAVDEDVARRIWRRDESLWGGPGVPEIGNRLGWLTITDAMLEEAGDLMAWARACREEGLTDAVLLGMGGSSLAPEVIRRSFGEGEDALRLHVLDSTDPEAVLAVERSVDLDTTLFIVSSKSGGTIETLSHFRHFFERTGRDGARFVAVTDPGSGLAELGAEHGFRRVFLNDPDIGGRYSALSYFGLVPAALMGVDIAALLERAQVAEQACANYDSSSNNAGLWLGVAVGELALEDATRSPSRSTSRSRASACGSSSSSPSPPASRARGSSRSPTSRWARRRPTATTACSSTCATPTSPTRGSPRRSRSWARPATRCSRSTWRAGRWTWAGCSSSPSSPPPWRAGCSRSTPSTSPTSRRPRTTPPRCSRSTRPRGRCPRSPRRTRAR